MLSEHKNMRIVFIVALTILGVFVCCGFNSQRANAESKISCEKVYIIAARGSGQTPAQKDKEVITFLGKMKERLQGKVSFSTYELGADGGYKGHSYPAVKVDGGEVFGNGLGAMLSAGYGFKYGDSVKEGILELQDYINDVANDCPDARFVLMGYSQGAQLMGQALFWDLPKKVKDRVLFVALFGDPKLYLPEGEGVDAPACRGEQFSNWRRTVPDCRTSSGALDARTPYITEDMQDKVGLWCNDNDWICGSSKWALGNSGHVQYTDDNGPIDAATREATIKINKHFKSSGNVAFKNGIIFLSKLDRPREGQDLVVIVDRNDENELRFSLRMQAVMKLANTYWDNGGRFGIVTMCHRPSFDNPSKNASFYLTGLLERGSNPGYVYWTGNEALAHFQHEFGQYCGSENARDFDYGVVMTVALDSSKWRSGVEKAILFSSNHTPGDITDPALKSYIKKRALEIDPVNVYTVSSGGSPAGLFEDISDATGGRSLFYDETQTTAEQAITQASDMIADRPIVRPSLGSFSAKVGEPIVLSVWSSLDEIDDHLTYRWDYNADGVWDDTTTQPFGVTTFPSPGDKIVHVEITGSDGSRASTVVPVVVTEPEPESTADLTPPTDVYYTVLETKDTKSTIRLEWQPRSTVYRYMLSIDGVHEGWLDNTRTSIDLLDIDRTREVTIELQAYDQNLIFGDRAGVVVPPLPVEQAPQPRMSSTQIPEQQPQGSSQAVQPSVVFGSQTTDPEPTPFMLAQSRDKASHPASSSTDMTWWIVGLSVLLLALVSLVYFHRKRATTLHE